MQLRAVVTLVEHINLRELAISLKNAEQEGDMEQFQAHLRAPGKITREVHFEEVRSTHMQEVEFFGLAVGYAHDLHEEVGRRILYRPPASTFRDHEFKKGGRRSFLLRHASSQSSRKKGR